MRELKGWGDFVLFGEKQTCWITVFPAKAIFFLKKRDGAWCDLDDFVFPPKHTKTILRFEQGFWEYTKICPISYTIGGIWAPKIKTDNQRRGGKRILDFWCMLHGRHWNLSPNPAVVTSTKLYAICCCFQHQPVQSSKQFWRLHFDTTNHGHGKPWKAIMFKKKYITMFSSKFWSLTRVELNRFHYHQVDVVRLQSVLPWATTRHWPTSNIARLLWQHILLFQPLMIFRSEGCRSWYSKTRKLLGKLTFQITRKTDGWNKVGPNYSYKWGCKL